MKVSQFLFFVSFLSSTIWALPQNPLGFFAKVKGTLRPLGAYLFDTDVGIMSILSHGEIVQFPTEFTLVKNKTTSQNTSILGPAGLYHGVLVFGPPVNASNWEFDENMKIENVWFSSCEIPNSLRSGLFYGASPLPKQSCVEADVYLLPYDRKTGIAIKSRK